jgi:predicted amidophosphoribosyltransferase
MKSCIWKCGGRTKNRTGICDDCWRKREAIYVARKAREAAEEKKPLSPARQAALEKLNAKRRRELDEAFARHGTFSAD